MKIERAVELVEKMSRCQNCNMENNEAVELLIKVAKLQIVKDAD